MELCLFTHAFSGMKLSTLPWNNENNYNNCNITIFNNLAHHLLSVFWAFEAQVPENVIHKMQQLLVEKKKIREFCPILVHAPGKDCITACRAWPKQRVALLTPGPWLLHSKVRPPLPLWWDARLAFQRLRQGKGKYPCQSVIEEIIKHWWAGLHPVLCCPSGRIPPRGWLGE